MSGEDTDQGLDAGHEVPVGRVMVFGDGTRAVQFAIGGGTVMVETRRLELLTLSLQRRCSTS
jgi:hypothetical protein